MNVLLQRHCARYIYVIPEGLRELMSDISREVLRTQPEQLYTFIADYLDALLITRENARVAAKFVENITEIASTIADLLIKTGITRTEADRIATIIQVSFRKHLSLKPRQPELVEEANIISDILYEANISPEQAEAAAIVIQTAYRNFKAKQARERELLHGMIDWRIAARSAIQLYRKTGVTNEEANRAATLIKAAYKGYYTRRIMKRLMEEGREELESELEEESKDETLAEYLKYVETSGEGYYIDDEGKRIEKTVRLDYQTIRPHVDFNDPTYIKELTGELSATTISKRILDQILSKVIPDDMSESDFTETTILSASELPDEQTLEPIMETKEDEEGPQVGDATLTENEGDDIPPITDDSPQAVNQDMPDNAEPSPEQTDASPEQGEPSPDQGVASPEQGEASPEQGETSPEQGEITEE